MQTRKLFVTTSWLMALALLLAGCSPAVTPAKPAATEQPPLATAAAPKAAPTEPATKPAAPSPTAKPAADQPKPGGIVETVAESDPADLDGLWSTSILAQVFVNPSYNGLLQYDPLENTKIVPRLAEKWDVSPDGQTITFALRKGVKWHDGQPFTAQDVKKTMDLWQAPPTGKMFLGGPLKQLTKAVDIVDDYTVKVTLQRRSNTYLAFMAAGNIGTIGPKHILDKQNGIMRNTVVGTGPFKYQEGTPGDHLTLVRFPDYWRKGGPYLDKVVITPIPDSQARLVNLQAGSIDALNNVPLADIALLQKTPGINIVRQAPGFSFDAFLFNVSKPPFDNTLVRQALNYAVDREKLRNLAYHDLGITTTLPLPPTSWAYPQDLANRYPFDLAKAKELLTQAGYPNGFAAQLTVRGTGGVALDAAQIWQEDLAKIGVKLAIVPTELPQYWPKLYASEFEIVSHGTGDSSADPSGIFQGAACCRPFRNFFKITENKDWFPKYKSIIEQAESELDQAKRKTLYHDAMAIFVEQGWTIPLGWTQNTRASKDSVRDIHVDMGGHIWLNEAWLSK